ncbi:hypothetical protein TSAR_004759 [Trichomalopsis sarcophagae]|uniref:Uncharacterized protein n=1 Tax=Trichomalopsis sarcophagae TaxID=543379 RepID=A0A232FKS2_9HYME|nr:hypothetical protein TSAR_004759 [Trichomalopsis sarcophagae]
MRAHALEVYPVDQIPMTSVKPCGFVFDTQSHKRHDIHWVEIYVFKNKVVWYFDSFGGQSYILDNVNSIQRNLRVEEGSAGGDGNIPHAIHQSFVDRRGVNTLTKKRKGFSPKCLEKSEALRIERKGGKVLSKVSRKIRGTLYRKRKSKGALSKVQMSPWRVNNLDLDLDFLLALGGGLSCKMLCRV